MELSLKEQEVLVASLESAPSLLDPATTGCQLMETHISWVILTDRYAYKLKKAVDLGFVDYSSLEKRRHFCEEELRLNRRTAPQIYLGTVAFRGRPEAPAMEDGPTIEYAVKMRRFPQENLLDRWALEDRLHPEHIDQVAEAIARFHGEIPAAGVDERYGEPQTQYRPMQENFEHLSGAGPRQQVLAREQQVWVATEFARLRPLIKQRKREGFIRECHGDLHLGNLAEVDGRIIPFDCIEFNPALRWIDVMSELAFLLMDLEHRGHLVLAARLLDRYLQHTGDYGGVALLRLYKHYRAMVRAKVTLIRLAQSDLSQPERLRLIEEFGAYLTLAATYTHRPEPRLILTVGPSGCGKTYVTDTLLQPLGAIRIRSDVERKRLFGLAADESSRSGLQEGIYSGEATERTYSHLEELARTILTAGYTCIVDATFLGSAKRKPFLALADELGVPVRILEFQTARSVLEKRVTERARAGTDASEADLAVLARQLESMEPLSDEERQRAITVDSGGPVSSGELVEQVLSPRK